MNVCLQEYTALDTDLKHIGDLGSGSCGHVVKMKHAPSQKVVAVKVGD